jgi:transcription-repair coupling factor (superfamily II helicase)
MILAAVASAALRRPTILVVDSDARAEEILGPLRFFFRIASGNSLAHVLYLPALTAMPWDEVPPHPAILETRAMTLWRMATGQAQVVVAPVGAATMRYQPVEAYAELGRTITRNEDISLDDFLQHLDL